MHHTHCIGMVVVFINTTETVLITYSNGPSIILGFQLLRCSFNCAFTVLGALAILNCVPLNMPRVSYLSTK